MNDAVVNRPFWPALEALMETLDQRSLEALRVAVRRLQALLDARPRVVLLGEPNAGKTSLANALLGVPLLPESALCGNTRTPIVLSHGEAAEAVAVTAEGRRPLDANAIGDCGSEAFTRLEIRLPLQRLSRLTIVDTPGLESDGQRPAVEIARGDTIVWCTMAGQAWKESERRAWSGLPAWLRTRALLAVTNADMLSSQFALERVRGRLRRETAGLFRDVVFTGKPRPELIGTGDPRTGIDSLEQAMAVLEAERMRRCTLASRRLAARLLARAGREIALRATSPPVASGPGETLGETLGGPPGETPVAEVCI